MTTDSWPSRCPGAKSTGNDGRNEDNAAKVVLAADPYVVLATSFTTRWLMGVELGAP